jgi:hypothetical protein
MSSAAVDAVKAFAHQDVKKGSARRVLLETIAEQIPDGETVTKPLTIPELSTLMGFGHNAAREGRKALARLGVIRIVKGGQGEVSRYELLLLPDAVGNRPSLPLVGAAAPRRDLKPRKPARPDLPLLDLATNAKSERIVENIDPFRRSTSILFGDVARQLRSFSAMLLAYFAGFRRYWRWSLFNIDPFRRSTRTDRAVLTTARDVHTFKNVHTPAAPRDGPPTPTAVPPPRCRYTNTAHAWCDGRVHVPTVLHGEFVRKFRRLAGETDADVEATLRAFYARTCDQLRPDEMVTENDFAFWRPRFVAMFATAVPARAPSTGAPRRPDIPIARPCPHDPPCAEGDTDACVDRSMADWRRDQARSG